LVKLVSEVNRLEALTVGQARENKYILRTAKEQL